MTEPLTPAQVVAHLAALSRELDATVDELHRSDLAAFEAERAHDAAFARAYFTAEGPVEDRKRRADLNTMSERESAEVAHAARDYAKNRLRSIERRIDVGRTYSAAVRAEVSLAGRDGTA